MKKFIAALCLTLLSACQAGPVSPMPDPTRVPSTPTPRATSTRLPSATPRPTDAPPTLAPSPTPTTSIRLLFTGDINPGRCPAEIALQFNDFTLPYQVLSETFRSADILIGSLDGSLSDLDRPTRCHDVDNQNLIGPTRTVEGLAYAGFDVMTVATNHVKNCGRVSWTCDNRAFFDTLHTLSTAGVRPVGGGATLAEARQPVIIERHGVRFAFLAVNAIYDKDIWATATTAGTAPLTAEAFPQVLEDIRAARQTAEVVIVLPQWGVEYAPDPTEEQWEWAGAMIDAGATLVIGNQPHQVQAVETFPSGVVAYALGNLVFDQATLWTKEGVLFEATFEGSNLTNWQLLPIRIFKQHQPAWPPPHEAEAILKRIKEATDRLPKR